MRTFCSLNTRYRICSFDKVLMHDMFNDAHPLKRSFVPRGVKNREVFVAASTDGLTAARKTNDASPSCLRPPAVKQCLGLRAQKHPQVQANLNGSANHAGPQFARLSVRGDCSDHTFRIERGKQAMDPYEPEER